MCQYIYKTLHFRLKLNWVEYEEVSISTCLIVYPIFYLFGNQMQSLIILTINIDRLIAVAFYVFYFKHKKPKILWSICSLELIFGALSVATNFLHVDFERKVDSYCITEQIIKKFYLLYHFGLNCALGISSAVVALCVVYFFKKRKNKGELNWVCYRGIEYHIHESNPNILTYFSFLQSQLNFFHFFAVAINYFNWRSR